MIQIDSIGYFSRHDTIRNHLYTFIAVQISRFSKMFARLVIVAVLMAVASAFKRAPIQMNVGNKIAAAFIAGAMVVMPSTSFASDLSTPVIEKRAKFSIGAGIQNSVDLEKRAKFSIGAGIQKSHTLEKRAKFSIGAGIQNSADLEKRAKFSIGAGIQ